MKILIYQQVYLVPLDVVLGFQFQLVLTILARPELDISLRDRQGVRALEVTEEFQLPIRVQIHQREKSRRIAWVLAMVRLVDLHERDPSAHADQHRIEELGLGAILFRDDFLADLRPTVILFAAHCLLGPEYPSDEAGDGPGLEIQWVDVRPDATLPEWLFYIRDAFVDDDTVDLIMW